MASKKSRAVESTPPAAGFLKSVSVSQHIHQGNPAALDSIHLLLRFYGTESDLRQTAVTIRRRGAFTFVPSSCGESACLVAGAW
jgi:hypothetical protein